MSFRATVLIRLKDDVLDTRGKAVAASLKRLGYQEPSVRVGRCMVIDLEDRDITSAEQQVHRMCQDLLVNPIIEEYTIRMESLG
ncbi:MAG: phosphoribosylformylglycinamidine synthase [Dethiosulfovibrio peptidovorans]|nr:MAG: phosphoribosylformylglycinamidine synthase [Dethiosulfovibrio peptidovorans]